MLPNFLLPDQVVRQNGSGPAIDLGEQAGGVLAVTLGVDLNRYWQFRVSQASLSEMNVYEDSVVLNLFNDVSHFQGK